MIADAEGYLSKHYSSEYYDIVAKSCEAEKKAENAETPQTGDSAHVVMNILVMAICAAAIVTVICRKRHVR